MLTFGIIEPHPVTQLGLEVELNSNFKVSKIYTAKNLPCFEAIKKKNPPDIVIIGYQGSLMHNLLINSENCVKMFPSSLVILYGDDLYKNYIKKLYASGIRGFVSKNDCMSSLVQCINTLQGGTFFVGARQATRLKGVAGSPDVLTGRQSEIAQLLLKGKSNKEIAGQLAIRPSTVSTVKKTIFVKMSVDNIVDLARVFSQYKTSFQASHYD